MSHINKYQLKWQYSKHAPLKRSNIYMNYIAYIMLHLSMKLAYPYTNHLDYYTEASYKKKNYFP